MVLGRSRQRFSVSPRNSAAGTTSRSCTTGRPCRRSRFSTCSAGSPGRRPSAAAASSSSRMRSKLSSSTSGASRRPSLRSTWKNWNRKRSLVCMATKVPRPWRRTRMWSATSSSTARRSVPTDTPKPADSSVSLGSASPGATTPSSMARSSDRLTARNSGMPAASGAIVASADSRGRAAGSGWRVAGMAHSRQRHPETCKSSR